MVVGDYCNRIIFIVRVSDPDLSAQTWTPLALDQAFQLAECFPASRAPSTSVSISSPRTLKIFSVTRPAGDVTKSIVVDGLKGSG